MNFRPMNRIIEVLVTRSKPNFDVQFPANARAYGFGIPAEYKIQLKLVEQANEITELTPLVRVKCAECVYFKEAS